jgi:hypothetical protein
MDVSVWGARYRMGDLQSVRPCPVSTVAAARWASVLDTAVDGIIVLGERACILLYNAVDEAERARHIAAQMRRSAGNWESIRRAVELNAPIDDVIGSIVLVVVEVEDNGPAVSSSAVSELFKVFPSPNRVGDDRNCVVSTSIVQNRGGHFTIDPGDGRGRARLAFRLPIAPRSVN